MKTLSMYLKLNRAVLGATLLVAMTAVVTPNEAFAAKANPISCLINCVRLGLDTSGKALKRLFSLGKRACGDVSETEVIPDVATFKRTCTTDPTNAAEIQEILNSADQDIEDIRRTSPRTAGGRPLEDSELAELDLIFASSRSEGTAPKPLPEGDQLPHAVAGTQQNQIDAARQPLLIMEGDSNVSHPHPSEPILNSSLLIEAPIHFDDLLLAIEADVQGTATLQQKRILRTFSKLKAELEELNERLVSTSRRLMELMIGLKLERLADLVERNVLSSEQTNACLNLIFEISEIVEIQRNSAGIIYLSTSFARLIEPFEKIRGALVYSEPDVFKQRVAERLANEFAQKLVQIRADFLAATDSRFALVNRYQRRMDGADSGHHSPYSAAGVNNLFSGSCGIMGHTHPSMPSGTCASVGPTSSTPPFPE